MKRYLGKFFMFYLVQWSVFGTWGIGGSLWGGCSPEQLKVIEDVYGWHLSAQNLFEIDQILL